MTTLYKLAPIEKSIVRVLEGSEELLTALQIAQRIKYVSKKDLALTFEPVLQRLMLFSQVICVDGKYGRL